MTNDVTSVLVRLESMARQRGPDILIGLAVFNNTITVIQRVAP